MAEKAASKKAGKKVLVGGVFNVVHPGHLWFLKKAKSYGDRLIVVVAHDRTVLKNKEYLLFPARERKKVIESLDFVDKVVVGDSGDMFNVVRKEKPDIVVLGYDQNIDRKELKKACNKTKLVRLKVKHKDYSTKRLLAGCCDEA